MTSNRPSLHSPSPLQQALGRRVVTQSIWIAIIVGSVLNVINQGDAALAGRPINLLKVALTFAVPFLVATFGAWSMARSIARPNS